MMNSIDTTNSYKNIFIGSEAMQSRRTELFQKVDTNSDNGVDQAEFSEFAIKLSEMSGVSVSAEEAFARHDENGDGSLSSDELDNFMKSSAPPPPPPQGGMAQPAGTGDADEAQQLQETLFGKVDSDGNGEINQSEFDAFIAKLVESSGKTTDSEAVFAAYDVNADDALSADELDSFLKENAPPPPSREAQVAVSSYGMNMSMDQLTSLINSLTSQMTGTESVTDEVASLTSDFVAKLREIFNARATGTDDDSSLVSIHT